MGNCLVLEERVIKVMKPDGKILEYKTPTMVQQVLSDFSGYAISDSVETYQYLLPDTQLTGGNLYYLIPLPLRSSRAKKRVRFSVPEGEESKQETGVVRIKVLISKQELQEILQRGGISVGNMVSELQNQQLQKNDIGDDYTSWKPVLESIPELD